ncbi:MAG TPA: ankyrin repeat domain-containing protein, partial [Candidatus Sumerlaeota bacterium]|nr:ankyrin repeat domain-containing protein [Candidatus Sumerlaeota bacterium]
MTARGWAVLGVCILCVSWAGAADSSLSIFEAARTGQLGAIETAIKGGASLNDRDDKGKTVLHYAAENGHVQTTQKLVQMGADPNIRDQAG